MVITLLRATIPSSDLEALSMKKFAPENAGLQGSNWAPLFFGRKQSPLKSIRNTLYKMLGKLCPFSFEYCRQLKVLRGEFIGFDVLIGGIIEYLS